MNEEKSIWITEEQLGKVQILRHRGRRIQYRLPEQIGTDFTLRFKGHGKTTDGQTGDLLLHVRVDRGRDLESQLWLSRGQARLGCEKSLRHGRRTVLVSVPRDSSDGQVLRVRGLGKKLPYAWGLPFFFRKRGDLLIKLKAFVDDISPAYRSCDVLRTEELALEGWVYRRIDQVVEKLGNGPLSIQPLTAVRAADLFNQGGWREVAKGLVNHLGLGTVPVAFGATPSLPVPGRCQKTVMTQSGKPVSVSQYVIQIRSEFVSDPFMVTAILAHELCHIIEARHLAESELAPSPKGVELTEMERTVDLLVFLFGLGEFQMRVARDQRATLGYFDQEIFERMHVILSRKRDARPRPGR